jgi:acyl-CoA synthetase (AMP-forming)/AMP-acid ligase II
MINLLSDLAHKNPNAPLLFHNADTYTFKSIADLIGRGNTWLAEQGIGPGDKVVIAVSNRPLFLFYWFSLLAREAIAVPVSHDIFSEGLRYIVQQSDAKAVFTEDAEKSRICDILSGTDCNVVSFPDESSFREHVSGLTLSAPATSEASSPAAILYTSGTTGNPKGVVVPVGSYIAAGREIVEAIGITAEDRILTFLPLHHANPQMYSVMPALTIGCSVILIPRFSASNLLSQAELYRATGFTYVGTILSILSKTISSPTKTGLRWCVGGGAPEPIWRDLIGKLGLRVHELYGMTETGGVTTINSRERFRVGSVGMPRDDFEVALLDDRDNQIAAGIGEIAIRPKNSWLISSGYYKNPEETVISATNLWFHTGDFGRFDTDGYLYFEGRKKELIRKAGEMISPASVELAATQYPAISDCAAVPVPDPILGEEIKLVIVTRSAIDVRELLDFLAARLPRHEIPRYIDFLDEIPKTPTQKIQRFKMKEHSARLIDLNGLKN